MRCGSARYAVRAPQSSTSAPRNGTPHGPSSPAPGERSAQRADDRRSRGDQPPAGDTALPAREITAPSIDAEEAGSGGSLSMEPGHLLMGLLREGQGPAWRGPSSLRSTPLVPAQHTQGPQGVPPA